MIVSLRFGHLVFCCNIFEIEAPNYYDYYPLSDLGFFFFLIFGFEESSAAEIIF